MPCTSRLAAALLFCLFPLLPGAAAGAERAAAIDYEVVARPADVLPAYAAAANAELTFLSITAIDGNRVAAALQQPRDRKAADTVLILDVHGSGDSFDKDPNGFLAPLLAAKGYAVLGINTRQAREKVNTDNFMSVRRDLEAAVYTARALGYRKLVLLGHSLGNIQVQYYAANNWDADIRGVILLGMFGNLPWKSRNILVQNEANWSQLKAASAAALAQGNVSDPLPVKMRSYNGQELTITAQHFLTYRAEESSSADGTYWIRRVPYPMLMVRDEADALIQRFEPNMLLAAAQAPGSLVPSIKYQLLPNARPPSLGAHYFVDNKPALVDAITGWLAERKL
jgi:alpha-beta hydrolase superfamily lysophospholipase